MSPANSASLSAATCIQCGIQNPAEAKFCSGCGQSLFQACGNCNEQIRIGVGFCSHCGTNIQELLNTQRENLTSSLVKARDLGRVHDYGEAIYHAASVVEEATDGRLQDVKAKAQQLLEKLQARKRKYQERMDKVVPAAKQAYQDGRIDEMVKLLESVPHELLDDQCKALLQGVHDAAREEHLLANKVRAAIDKKDFSSAGVLVSQILQLQPNNATYQKVAVQVGNEIMRAALRSFELGDYADAANRLDCVPDPAQDANYVQIRASLEELFWLREHVRSYPFATPTLAKFCEKLTKLTPKDKVASQLHAKIIERYQSGDADPRGFFARLAHFESEYWKCQPEYLARLLRIDCSTSAAISKNPIRFSAAIGAALQGVGKARLPFRFGGHEEKKGLRKLLQRKKETPQIAWGLDFGPSAIRLVRLELAPGEEVPQITDADFVPFESPTSRPTSTEAAQIVREHLLQLVDKYPIRDEPVWTLIPGRQTLGRFLELPPTDPKQVAKLADAEIDHQFPVPREQLSAQTWIAEQRNAGEGQYASVVGVRSFIIDQQLATLEEVGITPTGVQVDPVAIANLIYFEFADLLTPAEDPEPGSIPPGLIILDVGIEATNLIVCTDRRFWYRSFDMGGDTFSGAIAKQQKVPIAQADSLKQSLGNQPRVAPLFDVLEQQYATYNVRVKQLFSAAKREIGEFTPKGLWCTGGGCLVHGFIHRTFTDEV